MTKVADIVADTMKILRKLDPNEAPDAADARDCVRGLNLMMRNWEVEGLSVGWQDVAEVTDDLPAPPEAEEAIAFNLALRMRSRFGARLDQDVIIIAVDTLAILRAQVASNEYNRLSYPDLPAPNGQVWGNWRDGYTG